MAATTIRAQIASREKPAPASYLEQKGPQMPTPALNQAKLAVLGSGTQRNDNHNDIRITGGYHDAGTALPLFAKGPGDAHEVSGNDPKQGPFSRDCFLIASMAVIAHQRPDLFKEAIQKNQNGTFTVTLYAKTKPFLWFGGYKPVKVIVNPHFPKAEIYDARLAEWLPINLHALPEGRELWTMLVEKAYGILKSGKGDFAGIYGELRRGGYPSEALEALAGTKSANHFPKYFSIDQLAKMHAKGFALILHSLPLRSLQHPILYKKRILKRQHAYWIEAVDADKGTLTLQDPLSYARSPAGKIVIPYDALDHFSLITANGLGNGDP